MRTDLLSNTSPSFLLFSGGFGDPGVHVLPAGAGQHRRQGPEFGAAAAAAAVRGRGAGDGLVLRQLAREVGFNMGGGGVFC